MSRIRPSLQWLSLVALAAAAACKVYDPSLTEDLGSGGSAGGASSPTGGAGSAGASPAIGGGGNAGGGASGSTGGADMNQGGTPNLPEDGGAAGQAAGGSTVEPLGGAGGEAGENAGGAEGGAGVPPVDAGIDIIDDFEDLNLTLANHDGRGGVWFAFQGSTSLMISLPEALTGTPPEVLGAYALHGGRSANADAATGFGADLKSGRTAYDGSRYTGIRLWAKATGTKRIFTVQMADVNTDSKGLVCNPASNAPNEQKCNNHFGKAQELSTAWAEYTFPFSGMTQAAGWGLQKPAIDKSKLFGFQIVGEANTAIDLWIDQIEFY